MMEETIEPGGCVRAVAQEFSPVPYGSIRSEQSTGALIPSHHDFQQILGGGNGELSHSQIIDDGQRRGDQRFHVFFAGCIDGGFGQVIEQFVGFAIAHAITLLNGRLSGGLRHMNFSQYPGAKGRDFFSLARYAPRSSRMFPFAVG
jgi:hypothetical protein